MRVEVSVGNNKKYQCAWWPLDGASWSPKPGYTDHALLRDPIWSLQHQRLSSKVASLSPFCDGKHPV